MSQLLTSGSVGGLAGNRQAYPEGPSIRLFEGRKLFDPQQDSIRSAVDRSFGFCYHRRH